MDYLVILAMDGAACGEFYDGDAAWRALAVEPQCKIRMQRYRVKFCH
jgi:hypothetical protein